MLIAPAHHVHCTNPSQPTISQSCNAVALLLLTLLTAAAVPHCALGALRAAQLQDGQQLTTALAGAAPLKVDIEDEKVEIEVPDAGNDDDGDDADVEQADITVGNSVIHIVDEVLIPASLRGSRQPARSG